MSRQPDLQNKALGIRVWLLPHASSEVLAREPDWSAGIEAWVVEADQGVLSPLITHWYGGVVHLRDLPGVRPPHRQFPGAEYEIMSFSIDPEMDYDWVDLYEGRLASEPQKPIKPHLLQPVDICYQWAGTTDAQAKDLAGAFLRAVLAGNSPDRPVTAFEALMFDQNWKRVLDATVEHYTSGHWPVTEGRA